MNAPIVSEPDLESAVPGLYRLGEPQLKTAYDVNADVWVTGLMDKFVRIVSRDGDAPHGALMGVERVSVRRDGSLVIIQWGLLDCETAS